MGRFANLYDSFLEEDKLTAPKYKTPTGDQMVSLFSDMKTNERKSVFYVLDSEMPDATTQEARQIAFMVFGSNWYNYSPIFHRVSNRIKFVEALFDGRNPFSFRIITILGESDKCMDVLESRDVETGSFDFTGEPGHFDYSRYGIPQEDVASFRGDVCKFVDASIQYGFPICDKEFTIREHERISKHLEKHGKTIKDLFIDCGYFAMPNDLPSKFRVYSKTVVIGNF